MCSRAVHYGCNAAFDIVDCSASAAGPLALLNGLAPAMPRQLDLRLKSGLEPKAIDISKGASTKIEAAKMLGFTAVGTFESLVRIGQPLAYLSLC